MIRTHSYKLFVDDMREAPKGWICARNVSEAIQVLASLPVSHLSLDHDILAPRNGTGLYQALSSETFKGVAYYISLMPKRLRPKIRIHTANAGAAMTLCQILGVKFNEAYKFYTPESYE